MSEDSSGHDGAANKAALGPNGTQRVVHMLLEGLSHGRVPADKSPKSHIDSALELLHDRAALSRAREQLSLKSQDKSLDVIFRACISAMVGVLNLFLDPELLYTWREASMIATKAQGGGSTRARRI